ncbi:GNAT family N-acetyltransferase [Streptomyces tateyamensis]|uniref:GNAT family N-acetyltransferase n=1 Tax=Streptomyces tateyamensis TaxID=565073 RepID=A0A2V4NN51_9ACTN|nr:GNAT family N-acetyltransferase [Streptomyces tateyamensis]PYC77157.1 GNAT family N-acetyltransferase [Streptomyces tateyamensis]
MDNARVLETYDRELRREAVPDGPGAVVHRTDRTVRHDGGPQGWSAVLWSDLDEAGADAAIAEQVAYFAERGREFEWKHYRHDRPADLAERLLAAGFTAEPAETLMVAEAAAQAVPVELPAGVRLRTGTDETAVRLLERVHEQAFGERADWLTERLLAQLAQAPQTLALVVAMAGDEPVGAARLELLPGVSFAGLWSGGTHPDWRGRGLYRALVAHRAQLAVRRGYRYLQVDAADTSRPILERLGFAALSVTTPFTRTP